MARSDANTSWVDENDLSPSEWERLERDLIGLSCRFTVDKPQEPGTHPALSRRLLIHADGVLEAGLDSGGKLAPCYRFHLDGVDHPRMFFMSVLRELRRSERQR